MIAPMRLVALLACTLAGCAASDGPAVPEVPGPEHATSQPPHAGPAGEPRPDLRADTLDLAFAGDVMFGRYVKDGFREIPAERHDPFRYVAALLDSDFTMVNLETPILRRPPKRSPYGTRFRFVTTKARAARLVGGNIDAVTLANNHAYDMRLAGVIETPQILDELGIRYVGAHRHDGAKLRAETIEVRGWRIGYVAATTERNEPHRDGGPELPHADRLALEAELVPVIAAARADHDLVIVVLHWGIEYEPAPADWQVSAARAFIDAGADAVVGHHPHVLQGIERYGDGIIAYSLGNLVFDNLRPTRRLHGILHLEFRRDGSCLAGATFHPTVGTSPRFTPKPAGDELDTIADRLRRLSTEAPLASTEWTVDGATLTAAGACASPQE
jgi:poly-gamma-glutamate capsule biosynthesis protein CapA/YwtB (metallophosphatase superfamily)